MMKMFILFIFLCGNIFAYQADELVRDYQNGDYQKVCISGTNSDSRDEVILSLIGNACLKIDNINPLGIIVKRLVSTPKFRENASYFATILLQKKLIYQFMNDGINISNMRLPRTSYILSIVFENIAKKNYKIIDEKIKKIKIVDGNRRYLLWLTNSSPAKVIIDEYRDDKLYKRHWYL